jgi:hypothetical protein
MNCSSRRTLSGSSTASLKAVRLLLKGVAIAPIICLTAWICCGNHAAVHAADEPSFSQLMLDRRLDVVPYQVEITLQFGRSAELDQAFRERLQADVRQTVQTTIAPFWSLRQLTALSPLTGNAAATSTNLAAEPAADLDPSNTAADAVQNTASENDATAETTKATEPSTATPSGVAHSEHAPTEPDLRIHVEIERTGSHFNASVAVAQPNLQLQSPRRTVRISDSRRLAAAIVQLSWQLFRPWGRVETVNGSTAQLLLKAGQLLPSDETCRPVVNGQALQPTYRYLDRQGALSKLQPVPWTYLVATGEVEGAIVAKVETGLRMALNAKQRGRVELIAYAVRQDWPETVVQLQTLGNQRRSLVAQRVDLLPRRRSVAEELALAEASAGAEAGDSPEAASDPAGDGDTSESSATTDLSGSSAPSGQSASEPRQMFSDRRGRLRIPTNSDGSLLWLRCRSGEFQLALVPLVPGNEPQVVLELPDDSTRLAVEGELAVLQSQLVDTVARQAALFSRIRSAARKSEWDQVDRLWEDVTRLPTRESYLERIAGVRVSVRESAGQPAAKAVIGRVDRLCNQVKELVDRYLDPDRTKVLREETAELRRVSRENPTE